MRVQVIHPLRHNSLSEKELDDVGLLSVRSNRSGIQPSTGSELPVAPMREKRCGVLSRLEVPRQSLEISRRGIQSGGQSLGEVL